MRWEDRGRKVERCFDCGKPLDYEIGSPRWWSVGEPHRCASCEGKYIAEEMLQGLSAPSGEKEE